MTVTQGGRLEDAVRKVVALSDAEEPSPTPETAPTEGTQTAGRASPGTGSGFVVSSEGHVLTNAHVVENCDSILVEGKPAIAIDASAESDLSILIAELEDEKSVAVFSAGPARLNSDVTVASFPYSGLLGGLNITRGSVSSLKGFAGSSTQMQITAPIQPGNSGGPVVASDGTVVGVVVSKLDALKILDAVGDIPQNVNFAVRGEIAKLYLGQNGIDPVSSMAREELPPEELAKRASDFTVLIECR